MGVRMLYPWEEGGNRVNIVRRKVKGFGYLSLLYTVRSFCLLADDIVYVNLLDHPN